MILSCQHVLIAIILLCLNIIHFAFPESTNDINTTYVEIVNRHGKTVYIRENLLRKLEEEKNTWHWTPWLRTRLRATDSLIEEDECPEGSSADSFPESWFTDEQLRKGGFLLYVLLGIYSFTLLAIVCNDYFIPCVELICEELKIPENVAAATFMAVATSCPEFFVNLISTLLIESDLGIGTIVGSAIFNALGVAAIGGLAAIRPIPIEMRPVTRDVLVYMIAVSALVAIVWDGYIDWYEALTLAAMYILYFFIMFNSTKIFNCIDRIIIFCKRNNTVTFTDPNELKKENGVDNKAFTSTDLDIVHKNASEATMSKYIECNVKSDTEEKDSDDEDKPMSVWKYPKDESTVNKFWWFYSWPLKFLLTLTIPSTRVFKRLYPLAFAMCIVWIGANSYLVSWSMTVIGHTFRIPDSVMGMTFLAFGGCLPEALSIFIMSRRAKGGIGVSNALGANSLAILFALSLPWLIKSLMLVFSNEEQTSIKINSTGMDFVIISILLAVALLWLTLFFGKFVLRKSVGVILAVLYVIFITFAILVEMGVIINIQRAC